MLSHGRLGRDKVWKLLVVVAGCSPSQDWDITIDFLLSLLAVAPSLVLLKVPGQRHAATDEKELVPVLYRGVVSRRRRLPYVRDSHIKSVIDQLAVSELMFETLKPR